MKVQTACLRFTNTSAFIDSVNHVTFGTVTVCAVWLLRHQVVQPLSFI